MPAFAAGLPFSTDADERAARLVRPNDVGERLVDRLDRDAEAAARDLAGFVQIWSLTFIATSIGIANDRPM